jgi:hypothetical protein
MLNAFGAGITGVARRSPLLSGFPLRPRGTPSGLFYGLRCVAAGRMIGGEFVVSSVIASAMYAGARDFQAAFTMQASIREWATRRWSTGATGKRAGHSGCCTSLSACIQTFWPRPSPTSWHGSLGPCWHKSAAMKHASLRPWPKMNTLRFTKGIVAAPRRHRRSPLWANKRRWLRGDGSS